MNLKKKKKNQTMVGEVGVFWLNIVESRVYLCIGTAQSYLSNWRKRVNFSNGVAEILTKSMREETQVMWWEDLNLSNLITEILAVRICYPAARWKCPQRIGWKETNCGKQVAEIKERENKNCGNQVAEIVGVRREKIRIVATKLPKMGGKKEEENYGNQVAENVGKKDELWRDFSIYIYIYICVYI